MRVRVLGPVSLSDAAGEEHGALLLVARPEHDPVPSLRTLAGSVRLPGDARPVG